MTRKWFSLSAVLLMAIASTNAEKTLPHASPQLRDVLADNKYAPSSLADDVTAEFVDFDGLNQAGSARRLQNGKTTETTRCNTWCKLKESLRLTIVGLLLICIR